MASQECLAENEHRRYTGLNDKRLKVEIDDYILYYAFLDGFSSESFKRILFDKKQIELPCLLDSTKIQLEYSESVRDVFSFIPVYAVSGIVETGALIMSGLPFFIMLRQPDWYGYFTPRGIIAEESKSTLATLAEMSVQSNSRIPATMKLSLCD
jgi:hypothetical protein